MKLGATCIALLAAVCASTCSGTESNGPPAGAGAIQLVFLRQPSNDTATAVMEPAVRVAARDAQGQIDESFTDTVVITLFTDPSGSASLDGVNQKRAQAGIATFDSLLIDRWVAGYRLRATARGLTGVTSEPFDLARPQYPPVPRPTGINQSVPQRSETFSDWKPLISKDTANPLNFVARGAVRLAGNEIRADENAFVDCTLANNLNEWSDQLRPRIRFGDVYVYLKDCPGVPPIYSGLVRFEDAAGSLNPGPISRTVWRNGEFPARGDTSFMHLVSPKMTPLTGSATFWGFYYLGMPAAQTPVYLRRDVWWESVPLYLDSNTKTVCLEPGKSLDLEVSVTIGMDSTTTKSFARSVTVGVQLEAGDGTFVKATASISTTVNETYGGQVTVSHTTQATKKEHWAAVDRARVFTAWNMVKRYYIVDAQGNAWRDANYRPVLDTLVIAGESQSFLATPFSHC